MGAENEMCEYCRRSIPRQEQAYIVDGKVACEQCGKRRRAEAKSMARETRTEEPLPVVDYNEGEKTGIVPQRPMKRIKAKCPRCGRSLRGATTDMIGDTGVCPKCHAEFEIGGDLAEAPDRAARQALSTAMQAGAPREQVVPHHTAIIETVVLQRPDRTGETIELNVLIDPACWEDLSVPAEVWSTVRHWRKEGESRSDIPVILRFNGQEFPNILVSRSPLQRAPTLGRGCLGKMGIPYQGASPPPTFWEEWLLTPVLAIIAIAVGFMWAAGVCPLLQANPFWERLKGPPSYYKRPIADYAVLFTILPVIFGILGALGAACGVVVLGACVLRVGTPRRMRKYLASIRERRKLIQAEKQERWSDVLRRWNSPPTLRAS
jgi:hypothetical protein